MAKLKRSQSPLDPEHEEYLFWCPGCKSLHCYVVKWGPRRRAGYEKAGRALPTWTFNGNLDSPTFSPSLLYWGTGKPDPGLEEHFRPRCHLYLRNGRLEFLGDCEHEFAGKTVPLEDIP